jgi:hypothetical protein
MAAILKLRRGSTTPTSLEQSELFYNSTLATIQVGKSSASNDNITLVKLTETNTGNLQIVGTISGSALTLSGDITAQNLTLGGNATIAGNITFSGSLITFGNEDTDNIVFTGELSSSLIPNNDNTFDIGSTDKKYRNVYANNLYGGVKDSSLLNFTASQETKNSTLATYTGSVDTKFLTLASVTGSTTASIVELFGTASNHATKFTTLATYTGSVDAKFSTLAPYTASATASIVELFGTASNHESRIVYLSGSFSQSVDNRLDQLETNSGSVNNSVSLLNAFTSSQNTKNSTLATYTGSVDSKFTTLGTYTGSVDLDLISIHTYTASQDTKNSTLATYTGSVNAGLNALYATASDHETRIDGIQDYTSSLRTAIGVNGTNVTINGDLSVLGTTTQINSTQVNIGENILELNYGGSATTAGIITKDATGGSTISGSLLWDATNDFWKGGKLGSESKLLLAGGDGVVSGSAQVVDALKFTFLEIDGDDVVSGSSQVDLTQTTNYSSGIKTRLNAEGVVSGSAQVVDALKFTFLEIDGDDVISGSSQVDLTQTTNYSSGIKNRLDIEGVFSGSTQVNADSITNFDTNVKDKLDIEGVFSGSSQVNADTITNFDTNVKDKLNVDGVISGSSQVTASLDTRYLEINGDSVVSGSSQVTASLDIRYAYSASFKQLIGEWDYGTQGSIRDSAFYSVTSSAQLDTGSITSASLNDTFIFTAGATKEYVNWRTEAILNAIAVADITAVAAGNGLTGGGTTGDVTLSLDTNSSTFTTGVKNKLNTDGVISGSSQIVSILLPLNTFSASQETKNTTLGTYTGSIDTNLTTLNSFSSSINTTIKTKLDVEGVVSGSSQITIGGVSGFNVFSASVDYRLDALEGDTGSQDVRLDALEAFTSSQETKNTTLGTYTGSVDTALTNLNSFSASQETKDSTLATYTGSVDTKFNTIGNYTASNDTKWSNLGSQSGSFITESETGSFARVDVANIFTQTQTITGSMYISGDLIVQGSSSLENITASAVSIGTNIIYLNNDTPAVRFGGISVFDSGSTQGTGSLLWDSENERWIYQKSSGSSYSGGMLISGPRNTGSLGEEVGMPINKLIMGIGGDHISSSGIYHNGTDTAFVGNLEVTGSTTLGTANITTLNAGNGVVSGSSQVTLSSTTGGGTSANVQFGSLGIGMVASGTTGRIDATNDIVAYSSSDRRFKDNITPIQNALDKINQIGGYEFDWKEENKIEHGYEGHDLGVIAQEIETIAPELVQTRENGYKAVKYDKLVSVLIQAVKELSAKVTELENK